METSITKAFKKAKIKITLKTNYKKVMAKKVVYIKINKKTYKAKTNKKGVAAFKLKLPKVKKTYKYTVTFKATRQTIRKPSRENWLLNNI